MASSRLAGKTQWVFPLGRADGHRKDLLGGKGAELAEMMAQGLPVPPGFTITTEACREYYRSGKKLPKGLWQQVKAAMAELEESSGRKYGDPANPLLVSVRSGAAVSMPGMMETILNLGVNDQIVDCIARSTGNERFALDLYRRFIRMFSSVALGVDGVLFDRIVESQQANGKVKRGSGLTIQELREIISRSKGLVAYSTGHDIPADPYVQIEQAIRAVFDSWNTRRAVTYRNFHGIPHDLGTAVNIVAMVYGNRDDSSCTGVLFTRNPSSGEKAVYGEYLTNAQGEDVVAGTATPRRVEHLATEMPQVYQQLLEVAEVLERHYGDSQDVEFTVEQGKLYILQTRSAKRGAKAAVKIAVDMVQDGLITKEQALLRVEPDQIYQLLLPRFDEAAIETAKREGRLLAVGLAASPGGATGKVVFSTDTAAELGRQGTSVILTRPETSAEDVHGMVNSAGVLTSRGGGTSHAAVVARGMGKPCVTGAESIEVNPAEGYLRCGRVTVKEGEEISIDGATGEVFVGLVATIRPQVSEETELETLLSWADHARRLGVWANADYPRDAIAAKGFGAEGIGLCRTEHMFLEPERLSLVRDMILAAHRSTLNPDDQEVLQSYHNTLRQLDKLQVGDFEGIFRAMDGKPVVIRLLDPPLHEFLPKYDELLAEIFELRARGDNPAGLAEKEAMLAAVGEMREANPMLGLRGCRLGLMYPAIYEMQTRAILRAACNVTSEGVNARPEIMIPLVSHPNEMIQIRQRLEVTIKRFQRELACTVSYKIGTMIETSRAALVADEIAETAEFFSFGTNDLTQATFAFSRDDAQGTFLRTYLRDRVLPEDPFQVLDRKGVGQLIEMTCRLGRQTRPDLTIGICGEHGGDPSSIEFFHNIGLDYVSCSPYRVPVARLAAAQAAIRSNTLEKAGAPSDNSNPSATP